MPRSKVSLSLALLFVIACRPSAKNNDTGPPPPRTAADEDSAASLTQQRAAANVLSIAEVEASVAAHRGKIVVVDLWALW